MGGAGLAFPASICRRTIAFNFFAIFYSSCREILALRGFHG
jgi:hypothetical protein